VRRSYGVGAEFRSALRRFDRRTEEICRAHRLTSDQYTLLLMVKGAPGEQASVGELARRLHLAHNGVVERVQRAEEAGLVTRQRSDADRRVAVVTLTQEGAQRLAAAFAELGDEADLLIRYMAGVDEADRAGAP
jgi:DNA-binding MarR family transcriptional regulator